MPPGDPFWNALERLEDAPPHLLLEIEHFFRICKDLEYKKTGVEAWAGRDADLAAIRARLKDGIEALSQATDWLVANFPGHPDLAAAGAVDSIVTLRT